MPEIPELTTNFSSSYYIPGSEDETERALKNQGHFEKYNLLNIIILKQRAQKSLFCLLFSGTNIQIKFQKSM